MRSWIATWRRVPGAGAFSRRQRVRLHLEEMECRALLSQFVSAGSFAVGDLSNFVTAADVNRDGHLDLVVTTHLSRTASVLLGNGDGSFQAARNVAIGGAGPVVVADVNGDGRPD